MKVSLRQLSIILATLGNETRNKSNLFLALRKLDLEEDKVELEYRN